MSTEMLEGQARVPLAKGTSLSVHGRVITAQGPRGRVSRPFPSDVLTVAVDGATATLTLGLPPNRKRAHSLLNTWAAHIRNLSVGVASGFEARLKVVAAHFPMKVSVEGSTLKIENFLGEKHPRSAELLPGVTAEVDGEFVVLRGSDIEAVGQTSATIERATRIRDYDPRVFQDGIYLTEHAHPIGGGS